MDTASPDGPPLEFAIQPRTDRYDSEDDRWRQQVSQLYVSLRQEVGSVRREHTPVPGTKGVAEAVILALGSAGAFTAAVECFRAWLGRDKTRSLEITWSGDGAPQTVSIRGDDIDASVVESLAVAVAQQRGGLPWPNAATKPS